MRTRTPASPPFPNGDGDISSGPAAGMGQPLLKPARPAGRNGAAQGGVRARRRLLPVAAPGRCLEFPVAIRKSVKPLVASLFLLCFCQAHAAGNFYEVGGLVVMEAEDFQHNIPASDHAWVTTNYPAGYAGSGDVYASPHLGTNLTNIANSPQLTYPIILTNSGSFRLWIRGWAAASSEESVYVSVDSSTNFHEVKLSKTGSWVWNNASISITNSGPHQINLWMKQDGIFVDRLLLGPSSYTPSGNGPAETTFGAQITSPISGSTNVAYTNVLVAAQPVPATVPAASVSIYINGVLQNTFTSPPYSFTWYPPPGNYTITATATDTLGESGSSPPVSVTVSNPPPATVTYAASSDTIYVSGGGVATLTQINTIVPHAPLSLVDPVNKIWILAANIVVQNGSTLRLYGSAVPGGDVNQLRLESDATPSSPTNKYVWIDADWGILDLRSLKVTSWNSAAGAPATNNPLYSSTPRAYIRALSRQVVTNGTTNVQQSALQVLNSEIGWLGFDSIDGYGLNWEVANSTPGVNVFGSVSGSFIHDCQLGVDIWSSPNVTWSASQIATNAIYGFNADDAHQQAVVAANNVHDNVYGTSFRFSSTDRRIYVSGQGVATLSAIKAAVPTAALCLLDTTNHIWFLSSYLEVSDGATLAVHGSAVGGDVNELLLRSDNDPSTNNLAWVEADWGIIDIQNTKVISWNELNSAPDTQFAAYGRAFIRARSRLVLTNGVTNIQQSTLNVLNSEIGWLGSDSTATYGLDWQLDGAAPGVTVYGTVSNCYIHDCQMGVADWYGNPIYGSTVLWASNTVSSCGLFGFDPTDPKQAVVLADNNVVSNTYAPIFRWAGTDDRIYTVGEGTVTLSDIHKALPTSPLVLVDPTNMIWELNANLYVTHGTKLNLYGPAIGGDVSQLRLMSDHRLGTNQIVQLRADYGWLDIRNTKITSWNDDTQAPDVITNIYSQRRSFVHARSTLDTNGYTAHESRMDVYNSDIGYLGYHGTEAYGLVWKVVDTTAKYIPTNSTNTLYDLVKVYGNITNSHLHNNCFGMYAYGHNGGIWVHNVVESNLAYGFDPHNYSDYLDIENNVVHDNGWHGIIASIGCQYGIMRSNLSYNNGRDLSQGRGNGLMLHRSSGNWLVADNQSLSNRDSGMAIFSSDGIIFSNNLCAGNSNAGIRLSVGARSNLVTGNQFLYSGGNALYAYIGTNNPGTDEPSGNCTANIFTNNIINGTGLSSTNIEAIKVDSGNSNLFIANLFLNYTNGLTTGTNIELRFDGTNNLVVSNTLPTNTSVRLVILGTNSTNVTKHVTKTVTNIVVGGVTNHITNTVTTYKTNILVHAFDNTSVTFTGQPLLTLQQETNSTAYFTDPNGAIFDTDVPKLVLTNTVTANGSLAAFTSAMVGSHTNLVSALSFFVVPPSGSVQVAATNWSLVSPYNKGWIVHATNSAMPIAYRVGNLAPGTNYIVRLGKNQITSTKADSHGFISFSSNPQTTNTVSYTVSNH